jgi:SNF2 family DNA or RNA helicase
MLMPAKTAAAGLTLTAANRVILLEPAADPAIPQQAR